MLSGGEGMGTEKDFPRGLFEAYADGKITRAHFEAEFSAWQKATALCGVRALSRWGNASSGWTYRARRRSLSSSARWTSRFFVSICGKEAADAGN